MSSKSTSRPRANGNRLRLTDHWRRQHRAAIDQAIKLGTEPTHYIVVHLPPGYSELTPYQAIQDPKQFVTEFEARLRPIFDHHQQLLIFVATFDLADKAWGKAETVNVLGSHVDILLHVPIALVREVHVALAELNREIWRKSLGADASTPPSIVAESSGAPVHIQPITPEKQRGGRQGLEGAIEYVQRGFPRQSRAFYQAANLDDYSAIELSPIHLSADLRGRLSHLLKLQI